MPWDKERLAGFVREKFHGAKVEVVANREPYVHKYEGGEIRCTCPVSGLTTALDPVMRACGGVWVASASGNAAMYGMMASLPNRGDVNEIVLDLLDGLTRVEDKPTRE